MDNDRKELELELVIVEETDEEKARQEIKERIEYFRSLSIRIDAVLKKIREKKSKLS